jgi:hypothetical protein
MKNLAKESGLNGVTESQSSLNKLSPTNQRFSRQKANSQSEKPVQNLKQRHR